MLLSVYCMHHVKESKSLEVSEENQFSNNVLAGFEPLLPVAKQSIVATVSAGTERRFKNG